MTAESYVPFLRGTIKVACIICETLQGWLFQALRQQHAEEKEPGPQVPKLSDLDMMEWTAPIILDGCLEPKVLGDGAFPFIFCIFFYNARSLQLV